MATVLCYAIVKKVKAFQGANPCKCLTSPCPAFLVQVLWAQGRQHGKVTSVHLRFAVCFVTWPGTSGVVIIFANKAFILFAGLDKGDVFGRHANRNRNEGNADCDKQDLCGLQLHGWGSGRGGGGAGW